MYKQALTQAVNAMAEIYGVNVLEEKNRKEKEHELEEAEQAIDRLNSFIVDEKIKNNSAMPFYNKAQETHDKEDIMKAIDAVNELEEGHMYKQALTQAVNAMAEIYGANVSKETDKKEEAQELEKDDVNANDSKPAVETESKETNNTNPEEQSSQQTIIENNGDLKQQLLGERKKLELKLIAIDRYINGEYDLQKNKTESFDSKIASLENQINNIKANKLNNQPVSATAIFAESRKKLEELISNYENEASDAEIKATQLYYTAVSLPTVKNVVESLRNASALPDTSIIKQSLIDTVSKAAVAYIKDEDEIKEINDVMGQLNLNSLNLNNNSSYDEQINQLYQEINNINYERECRKNKLQFTINKIKSKIANIDEQIKTIDNPTKEEENETKQDDDILPPAPVDEEPSKNKIDEFIGKVKKLASDMNEKKEAKNNSKAEEFEKNNSEFKAYADKLSQIASDGAIFHDENRIDPENRWMEQKTAQALGKYNNDNMNINQPHVIKEKKKASLNLIQKVRNSKYAEKISIALEYLKKAKVAVVTAAMLVGIGAASLMAANQVEAEPTQQNQSQDNENSQSDYIENKETSNTELEETNENSEQNEVDNSFNAQLQEEINKILNGESGVYTSSDKAISGVDMKMPSANQLENSWTLAEPATFYNVDGDKISAEDAMNKVENGEQVAARMDNDRGTAGYINIGASTEENTQGMSR